MLPLFEEKKKKQSDFSDCLCVQFQVYLDGTSAI